MTDELRQIVVSLPRHNGIKIKHALKDIAKADSRSMSNQVCMILVDWLNRNSLGWNSEDPVSNGPITTQGYDQSQATQGYDQSQESDEWEHRSDEQNDTY